MAMFQKRHKTTMAAISKTLGKNSDRTLVIATQKDLTNNQS